MKRAPKMSRNKLIIVNLSGRGDKDVTQVADKVGLRMPSESSGASVPASRIKCACLQWMR
jgi:hypothetical protein